MLLEGTVNQGKMQQHLCVRELCNRKEVMAGTRDEWLRTGMDNDNAGAA